MVEKYWGSYWWGHAWAYILWSTLIHPLTELHILYWWFQLCFSMLVCIWFIVCHIRIWWLLRSWVHLICVQDKGRSWIVRTPPWGSLFWCIPKTRNILLVRGRIYFYQCQYIFVNVVFFKYFYHSLYCLHVDFFL